MLFCPTKCREEYALRTLYSESNIAISIDDVHGVDKLIEYKALRAMRARTNSCVIMSVAICCSRTAQVPE
jgi:hypothetical protein